MPKKRVKKRFTRRINENLVNINDVKKLLEFICIGLRDYAYKREDIADGLEKFSDEIEQHIKCTT